MYSPVLFGKAWAIKPEKMNFVLLTAIVFIFVGVNDEVYSQSPSESMKSILALASEAPFSKFHSMKTSHELRRGIYVWFSSSTFIFR